MLCIREYASILYIGLTHFFKWPTETPSPKGNAYISAKTHIDSFLASQIVTLANISPTKAPSMP